VFSTPVSLDKTQHYLAGFDVTVTATVTTVQSPSSTSPALFGGVAASSLQLDALSVGYSMIVAKIDPQKASSSKPTHFTFRLTVDPRSSTPLPIGWGEAIVWYGAVGAVVTFGLVCLACVVGRRACAMRRTGPTGSSGGGVGQDGGQLNFFQDPSADACCTRCWNGSGCDLWFFFPGFGCFNTNNANGPDPTVQCPTGHGRTVAIPAGSGSLNVGGEGPCSGGIQ